MQLAAVFRQLVLAEVGALPPARTGRPQTLPPGVIVDHIFKVLRTGMQWRELPTSVSYTTIFRRFQAWSNASVFQRAYTRALRTYRHLHPTAYLLR